MNLIALYKQDMITSLLFGGMTITMLVGFSLIFSWLKRKYRLLFLGYSFLYCVSFYFLFSAILPTRMQNLKIYWNIASEIHLVLFALTWFISICCLVRLIYNLIKETK